MSSNYTPNYQLNQWEADDQVQRVDFNADNAKIDAALAALDSRVEYGTYVGTGKCGLTEENATVLKLGYCPKMLFLWSKDNELTGLFFWPCARPLLRAYYDNIMVNLHWMEDGLCWWATNNNDSTAEKQFNAAGVTYYYAAFR